MARLPCLIFLGLLEPGLGCHCTLGCQEGWRCHVGGSSCSSSSQWQEAPPHPCPCAAPGSGDGAVNNTGKLPVGLLISHPHCLSGLFFFFFLSMNTCLMLFLLPFPSLPCAKPPRPSCPLTWHTFSPMETPTSNEP